ncbi:MAG: pyridoxamine 5'-phosphate oxidase family protein, partial [Pseudomonadota bacterium]
MKISESSLKHIFQQHPVARLATINAESSVPHALPIVFVPLDKALWSPIDGKPKSTAKLKRLANIRAHPETCLLLDEYAEDWQALWWLQVYCRAEVVTLDGHFLPRIHDVFLQKYP